MSGSGLIGFKEAKSAFFDRAAVMSYASTATRARLSRFGSYVRTVAKRSIRKRKGSSAPGSPPHGHGQELLRRFIFFAYDKPKNSVVIGPTRINGGAGEAPALEEYGGTTIRYRHGKPTTAIYAKRPYMQPAFEAGKRNLKEIWSGSVRK